jgi:FixJ family two-component response regulator
MKVFLVEDDDGVAASLEALLGGWGYACKRFATGEDFLAWKGEPPACILLDMHLPGMDGLAVLRAYRRDNAQTPVIAMTGNGNVALAVDALQFGAQDFLEKPFDGEDLAQRIRSEVEKARPDVHCRQLLDRLTPREREVLREVVAGHQNKQIAHNLDISQKTVELHRSRVMEKTGAASVSHLIQIALRGGIEAGDIG